jgi:hypothetical protein
MKKEYILAILFFGALWGISEAVLGDALYRADVPYASVPLTIIGFVIMAFGTVYFPQRKGTATLIAACAMLYKFLNAPFFACHLLGILLMGLCYDLFFSILPTKNRSLSAVAATYLNYALFALMITYAFRYDYWLQAGFAKVLRHITISGSIAALGCAVLVPLSFRLGERLKANLAMPFRLRLQLAPGSVSVVTIGLWVFSLMAYIS